MSDLWLSNEESARKSSSTHRRFVNKNNKELLYRRLFPSYTPRHNYSILFINRTTTDDEINFALEMIQQTSHYMLDTESDYHSNRPALIQIFLMKSINETSLVIILEIQFLPDRASFLFHQIQQIFDHMFRADAHLYAWGCLLKELTPFLEFQLFSFPLLSFVQNTQVEFAPWFNEWLLLYNSPGDLVEDITDDSVILNAPSHDPTLFLSPQMINHIKLSQNQLWSLQDAVVYVFQQYLSKEYTLRKWSIGWDYRLNTSVRKMNPNLRRQLIDYVVFDCVSVGQLVAFMEESDIQSAFKCIKYSIETSTYLQIRDKRSFVSSSSIDVPNQFFNYDLEDSHSITVHESDERYPVPDELVSDVDQQHQVPVEHHLVKQSKGRRKRSLEARRWHNQKSSKRHRRNRYKYEVIRPVNQTMTRVKRILEQHHVKCRNVNIVRSTLYIDLESQLLQDRYQEMLPMDLFL